MFSRDVILKELERRTHALVTPPFRHLPCASSQAVELDAFRIWVKELPTPEASALCKEARRHAADAKLAIEYGGTTDLLTDIADALEQAEAQNAGMLDAPAKTN